VSVNEKCKRLVTFGKSFPISPVPKYGHRRKETAEQPGFPKKRLALAVKPGRKLPLNPESAGLQPLFGP